MILFQMVVVLHLFPHPTLHLPSEKIHAVFFQIPYTSPKSLLWKCTQHLTLPKVSPGHPDSEFFCPVVDTCSLDARLWVIPWDLMVTGKKRTSPVWSECPRNARFSRMLKGVLMPDSDVDIYPKWSLFGLESHLWDLCLNYLLQVF